MKFVDGRPLFIGDAPVLSDQDECCCCICDCDEVAPFDTAPSITVTDQGQPGADTYVRTLRLSADGVGVSPAADVIGVTYNWGLYTFGTGAGLTTNGTETFGIGCGQTQQEVQDHMDTLMQGCAFDNALPANFPNASIIDSASYTIETDCCTVRDSTAYRKAVIEFDMPLLWGGYHGLILCSRCLIMDSGLVCVSHAGFAIIRTGLCDSGAPVGASSYADLACETTDDFDTTHQAESWTWVNTNILEPGRDNFNEIDGEVTKCEYASEWGKCDNPGVTNDSTVTPQAVDAVAGVNTPFVLSREHPDRTLYYSPLIFGDVPNQGDADSMAAEACGSETATPAVTIPITGKARYEADSAPCKECINGGNTVVDYRAWSEIDGGNNWTIAQGDRGKITGDFLLNVRYRERLRRLCGTTEVCRAHHSGGALAVSLNVAADDQLDCDFDLTLSNTVDGLEVAATVAMS